MIAETGHIALILAFCVALLQGILPLIGAAKAQSRLMLFAERAALMQAILITVSFVCLTLVFLASDFSVLLAAKHSHSAKPLLYKITGVWGNHEGSMLLWVLILAIYGALAVIFGRGLPLSLKARALAIQGLLGVGFIGFTLFTSNPFERLFPAAPDGMGLNPILQDPGLAFHPPFLYLGYVGFSLAFSFSVAALIEGRVDAVWARWLRPWVLLAWSFLTIGITLGSFWAYYELGWGGWWMWDPVENVSFMPWIAGTALVHSILVLGKRHTLAGWTVLLAISTFSLSMIGTFVVRSGVLVSVHSFAVDPTRGVYILGLLLAVTGGALALYAVRANSLRGGPAVGFVSKDGALVLNNMLLTASCATVFLGTFYPLIMDALTGDKISVGAPYFNLTYTPIMLLLLVFMGAGPLLKWQKDSLKSLRRFAVKAGIVMAIIAVLAVIFGKLVFGALAFALAGYLALATLARAAQVAKVGQLSPSQSLALLRAQPASFYGFLMAHFAMAIFTAAVTALSVFSTEAAQPIKIGESLIVGAYEITLTDVKAGQRENYQFLRGDAQLKLNGELVGTLHPERRFYPAREMITTEAGFRLRFGKSILVSLGEGTPQDGFVMRAFYHPYVAWVWISALMMALAGFIAMADRRLRFTRERAL